MPRKFKHGETVTFVPEMYDQNFAMFLHKKKDKAFIRLAETHEVRLVDLKTLYPSNHETAH